METHFFFSLSRESNFKCSHFPGGTLYVITYSRVRGENAFLHYINMSSWSSMPPRSRSPRRRRGLNTAVRLSTKTERLRVKSPFPVPTRLRLRRPIRSVRRTRVWGNNPWIIYPPTKNVYTYPGYMYYIRAIHAVLRRYYRVCACVCLCAHTRFTWWQFSHVGIQFW